jgi:hypothetical protein
MNPNIIDLSNKIEAIIINTTEFDNNCVDILADVTNKDINNKIYKLTQKYMDIRKNHGELLIVENNLKKNINKKIKNNNRLQKGGVAVDNNTELYDLSTFTSMIENVSNVVNNIDFEFKKIALMFPKYINNNKENIILFKEKNKNTKYSKWIDEIKEEKNNEIDINVIELSSKDIDSKYNLSKASLNDVDIKIKNLPSMFRINDESIIEIELKSIKNINEFKNYLN